ncbi:organic cation transporter protein-like [Patiria miniata]|uniref:Major facilitator superfamily (MFS) profile domain-containing protein n=1 Tax=Patiria miniata TaxID=46514 RepID=A0A913YXF5_PATMI|nr:organic cation transporter protein-like [Patiria miniata]
MDVDTSLKTVGELGRLQTANFLLFAVCITFASIQSNSIAFTIDQSVEHYCKPPPGFTANQTSPLINKDGREAFAGCEMYDVLNGTLTNNLTTCQYGWEYPSEYGATSIVTDLNLVCSRSLLAGTLMSMHFAGFLVGCFVTGQASDMFGRRTVCMTSLLLSSLLGMSISFIWNLELMMAARFLLGLVLPGNTLVVFVRIVEMYSTKNRLLANLLVTFGWVLGLMLVAPLAILLPNWRDLQLVVSLACIPLLPLHWFFSYESIRWLVQKGQVDRAESILQKIAKSKHINCDGGFLLSKPNEGIGLNETDLLTAEEADGKGDTSPAADSGINKIVCTQRRRHYSVLDLFKTRTLVKYSLIIFLCWFVMNMLYFGFMVYSTSLAGNKYLNFFLLALVEAPMSIVNFFILKRFGRRRPLIIFFFACAVFCFIAGFLPTKTAQGTDLAALIVAMTMLGKYFAGATYEVTMLIGAEVFPTVLRNIVTGSSATVGKTATIIAPFIVLLKGVVSFLPMTIFGTLSLVASLCVFFLPETRNKPLPEQYGDTDKLAQDRESAI